MQPLKNLEMSLPNKFFPLSERFWKHIDNDGESVFDLAEVNHITYTREGVLWLRTSYSPNRVEVPDDFEFAVFQDAWIKTKEQR